jgi:hypothetical protein
MYSGTTQGTLYACTVHHMIVHLHGVPTCTGEMPHNLVPTDLYKMAYSKYLYTIHQVLLTYCNTIWYVNTDGGNTQYSVHST